MALAAAGGASESDHGSVLQLEMMREFSGQDDVSQADMLVLRGLGLADVQVSDAPPRECARHSPTDSGACRTSRLSRRRQT